jgi:LysM repeat protein
MATAKVRRKVGKIGNLQVSLDNPTFSKKMRIRPAGNPVTLELPYAPRQTTHTGMAWTWEEVARTGRDPILSSSGRPRPQMSCQIYLGYKNPDQTCTATLNKLYQLARTNTPLYVTYSSYESGFYHINSLSVNVLQRNKDNHQPTQATVDISFIREIVTITYIGPVSGGKKAPQKKSNGKATKKYKVKKGDTLWSIAIKFYKNSARWRHIAKVNKIKDPRKLRVGRVLKITY